MMAIQYVIAAYLHSSFHACHLASHDSVSQRPRSNQIHWRRFMTHLSRAFLLFPHSYLDL